jgi:nicotinamide mononucleotide adenylyltransferase
MNYEDHNKQEVAFLNNIINRYQNLKENDISSAFKLMKDSLQAYNRWSVIRCDYRRLLKRGEKPEEKDRLEDICRYLKEVHTNSRMIWKYGKEDLRNHNED